MENPFKIILMDLYKLSPAKKLLTGTVARIMKRLQKEFQYIMQPKITTNVVVDVDCSQSAVSKLTYR